MKFENRHSIIVATVAAAIAAGAAGTAGAQSYVAQIGHLEAPSQPRHQGLERVAELVEERTDGEVAFELYPSSQLGDARAMNEGVQLGTIEGTVSPAAFLGGFNPAVSILDIPYLLPTDLEDASEMRQGEFGDAVLETFAERGFHAVGLWPNGRKHFTSVNPIADIEDFEGQRFRVMDSAILIEQFNALNASAVALPFGELYTALQTGVIEGQENPLDTIATMRFYEVQDYLLVSDHGHMEDVILFNPAWWESLPAEYQDIIVAAFEEVAPEVEELKETAQEEALATIREAGLEVEELTDEEKARMRETMYPRARDAYLEQAGEEGEALIELYEEEYARIVGE
ncbi:TRAP transporter substrate-binding protein [Fodinicurvata sp. EGI_FJ10296]|uniref:TRAP transporter substrate-binding protein n=1 Tax=Fodinicurvata sp. EGI_FJ10296 TaxID=3231908 RepID=UPI003456741C